MVFIGIMLVVVALLLVALIAETAGARKAAEKLYDGLFATHGTPRLAQIMKALEDDAEDRKMRQKKGDAREEARSRKKRYDQGEQIGHQILHVLGKDSFFQDAEINQSKQDAADYGVFSLVVTKGRSSAKISIYPELPLAIHLSGILESYEAENQFPAADAVKAVSALRNWLGRKGKGGR